MPKRIITALLLAALASGEMLAQVPKSFNKEYSGKQYKVPAAQSPLSLPKREKLPNPFRFINGSYSDKYKDWEHHRFEISHLFWQYEIGYRPSAGKESVKAEFDGKILKITVTHKGESLAINCQIEFPENATKPCPALLSVASGLRNHFINRGCAVINVNVMDVCSHTQRRGQEPINRLFPELEANGSYTYWGWCVSRVIDALEILGSEKTNIDLNHLAVSGCSWAGKAALYAGAFDERICLVIPQEPGGGGAAAWRYSETLGNVERSFNTNDAWFFANIKTDYAKENIAHLPVDHHELCALVCPRALLMFGNTDYEWLADESGYVSMKVAKEVYKKFGIADRIGFSIQGGHGHCQLPQSQHKYLEAYIDRFLLEKEGIDTEFEDAEMFKNVDWKSWMEEK